MVSIKYDLSPFNGDKLQENGKFDPGDVQGQV